MSIQNYIAKQIMLKTKRRILARSKGKIRSVKSARALLEKMIGRMKLASGIRQEPVLVGDRKAEWHLPQKTGDKVLLYLHGGGYFAGSLDSHRSLSSKFAQVCEQKVLALDYRLAPENPYPAAIDDALFAFNWLQEQGYAPEQIIIIGDSAGGGLSLSAGLALRDEAKAMPAALVLISPWTDLTRSGVSHQSNEAIDPILSTFYMDQVGKFYANEMPLSDPGISPLFAELKGLCPVFIQVGSDEILLDDSLRLTKKLEEAKVPVRMKVWEGCFHVWHISWPHIPEARKAIKEIKQFVDTIK